MQHYLNPYQLEKDLAKIWQRLSDKAFTSPVKKPSRQTFVVIVLVAEINTVVSDLLSQTYDNATSVNFDQLAVRDRCNIIM